MPKSKLTGRSGRRRQIPISIERIHLDVHNPRLPLEIQGKSEKDVLIYMYKNFDLKELAESIASNGYFDEEPLVVVPKDLPKEFKNKTYLQLDANEKYKSFIENEKTEFVVIEGNRRVSTIKILMSKDLQRELKISEWPKISIEIRSNISTLPAIVYPQRNEVIPYMGIRHITGIKKWDSYSKAAYVYSLVKKGYKINEIQKQLADRTNSSVKLLVSYLMVQEAEKAGMPKYTIDGAKDNFSYITLSIGQNPIKNYLGLPSNLKDIKIARPVEPKKLANLKNLFSWLFGESDDKKTVIDDSRQITDKLTFIIKSKESIDFLIKNRDLEKAFERSEGEEILLINQLSDTNINLKKLFSLIRKYKNKEAVKEELKKCKEVIEEAFKIVAG